MWAGWRAGGLSIGARCCAPSLAPRSMPLAACRLPPVNRLGAPNSAELPPSSASCRRGMQTLVALLLVATAACTIARPPDPSAAPIPPVAVGPREPRPPARAAPPPDYLSDDVLPRLLYFANQRNQPDSPLNDWLNREIYRIDQMDEDEDRLTPYAMDIAPWIRIPLQDMLHAYDEPRNLDVQLYSPEQELPIREPAYSKTEPIAGIAPQKYENEGKWRKYIFAFTPRDRGYYESEGTSARSRDGFQAMHQEGGALLEAMAPEPPRQTRQNPNLSKQKHLLGPDLGKLKTGLSDSSDDATDQPRHIHMLESASDPAESIYGVAIFAAIGAALTMAIFGFAFGWYTLSKKAKAAADVDYPAYGVTGPTVDASGDRKLAQSAHMYHYQHQKQQIIAMERNGMEQRAGSVSDPESEEENEEGDYTVYECPGFATTGDMEVKNPMFSEEPTPATPAPPGAPAPTPGRCELVKPQPKD